LGKAYTYLRQSLMKCLFPIVLGSIALFQPVTPIRLSSTHADQINVCFNMGRKPGEDYVIKHGNATKAADELELFSVFYAWLEPDKISNCTALQNWTVREVDFPPGIIAEWKQEGDGRARPIDPRNLTTEALTFDWKCTDEGKRYSGVVRITIDLPGFSGVSFSVNKTCVPLAPTPAPTPAILNDACFNMGRKPGVDYVIKNGTAFKVPDDREIFSVFYAWLEQANRNISNCSGVHNWDVKEIQFPAGGLIKAVWKQEGDGRALPLNSSNVTREALTINWICAPASKQFSGIVSITIGLRGYSDVTFSLNKTCFPVLTASPSQAHSEVFATKHEAVWENTALQVMQRLVSFGGWLLH